MLALTDSQLAHLAHRRDSRPSWPAPPMAQGLFGRFRGQTGKRFLPKRSFGSIHSACLSAQSADRAMEAWYHPRCMNDPQLEGHMASYIARRKFLATLGGAAAWPLAARAQAYPSRPVRIIVPFAPAGASDITARLIGQWLSERLGQQFVIENRPGGGGNIGTEAVVCAPADGYTLLMVGSANASNATFYDKLNFNFIRDIAQVGSVFRGRYVMVVNPSVPARSVPEFIAYAKTNPGKLTMASS